MTTLKAMCICAERVVISSQRGRGIEDIPEESKSFFIPSYVEVCVWQRGGQLLPEKTHQRLLCGWMNMFDSVYMYCSALHWSCFKKSAQGRRLFCTTFKLNSYRTDRFLEQGLELD